MGQRKLNELSKFINSVLKFAESFAEIQISKQLKCFDSKTRFQRDLHIEIFTNLKKNPYVSSLNRNCTAKLLDFMSKTSSNNSIKERRLDKQFMFSEPPKAINNRFMKNWKLFSILIVSM